MRKLFISSQSLAEFYAIVTNPRRVTIARTVPEAITAVESILALPGLMVISPPIDIVSRWCELLRQHPVTWADIFDLQIVATMLASGIRHLYTFNIDDFRPFTQIEVLVPPK
jgi:predicted nucleic acid-binding protein